MTNSLVPARKPPYADIPNVFAAMKIDLQLILEAKDAETKNKWIDVQYSLLGAWNCTSKRSILEYAYRYLVKKEFIEPIENMPEADKKDFWEQVKAEAKPDKRLLIDKLECKKLCRAVRAMAYLIENNCNHE